VSVFVILYQLSKQTEYLNVEVLPLQLRRAVFPPGLIKKVLSQYMHDTCTRYVVNGRGLNIAVR
jgi:hypothetical protein